MNGWCFLDELPPDGISPDPLPVKHATYADMPDESREAIRSQMQSAKTRITKQLIRDGHEYKCAICGASGNPLEPLQLDHIVPVSRGGKNTLTNLQFLCSTCNGEKGVRVNSGEFRKFIGCYGMHDNYWTKMRCEQFVVCDTYDDGIVVQTFSFIDGSPLEIRLIGRLDLPNYAFFGSREKWANCISEVYKPAVGYEFRRWLANGNKESKFYLGYLGVFQQLISPKDRAPKND